ncbi:LysR family transcriptional regulator [Raoultibacter phocaeensis]|uniref:LysR family transcriptional regulator n=1 Tax=Raoultibacter phocaeensis TaxID=2479841 RepID=UPI00111B756E|nr:LysR family transcriptional regulator [Raoultibacter phocaeensis]
MNINQVKYYVSVVDQGSFSAAAAEQFITAQGMSKAIADLEHEIGKQLLIRKNRGVEPTEFGKEFYERAKLVNRCFGDLEAFAKTRADMPEGAPVLTLLVSAPSFLSMEKVSSSVSSFVKANLGINVSVSFGLADQCIEALRDGSADAVIAIGEAHVAGIECSPIGTIPCGVQISKMNPLAQKKYLSLSDLENTPVAFWPNHDFFNETLRKRLDEKGANLTYVDIEQDATGLHAIAVNHGALLIPRISAIDEDALHTVPIPFDPKEGIVVPMCLLSLQANTSPKMMALRRFLTATNRLVSEAKTSDMISRAIGTRQSETH